MLKKAMQGHFKLNKARQLIPDELLRKTGDVSRIDMQMLNEYLNTYSDKLCRARSKEGDNIQLDELQFLILQKGVNKQTLNPYHYFDENKKLAHKMNREIT